MSNEKFTQLPVVASALPTDIIAAVQGGISVQETLSQVASVFLSSTVLSFAGNPNGLVAGSFRQLLWDTTNLILYVCTTTGTALSAVWNKSIQLTAGTGITIDQAGNDIAISTSGSGLSWIEVTTTSDAMTVNNGYIPNNAVLVSLALPTVSSLGDVIYIVGKGAGGFIITQAAGQQIHIGSASTTIGIGGSAASTNQFDSLQLVCTVANTTWTNIAGVQGNLTIV